VRPARLERATFWFVAVKLLVVNNIHGVLPSGTGQYIHKLGGRAYPPGSLSISGYWVQIWAQPGHLGCCWIARATTDVRMKAAPLLCSTLLLSLGLGGNLSPCFKTKRRGTISLPDVRDVLICAVWISSRRHRETDRESSPLPRPCGNTRRTTPLPLLLFVRLSDRQCADCGGKLTRMIHKTGGSGNVLNSIVGIQIGLPPTESYRKCLCF